MTIVEKLNESRKKLKSLCPDFPKFVVVSGSGLATLLQEMEIEKEISLSELPHVKVPSVIGHVGKLVIGKLGGQRVASLQGRLHFYEGYSMEEVVFPLRLLAYSGGEVFFLTNASGGIHPDMKPSDLVVVTDHLSIMGSNPLIGPNVAELGPRFPDMSFLYDREINAIIHAAAKNAGTPLRSGVYLALHGPSFETPAEIRMYRQWGADVVGMSTVPEAIALKHMGKRVVCISCVTNLAAGVIDEPLNHEEVLVNAKKSHPLLAKIIKETVGKLGASL